MSHNCPVCETPWTVTRLITSSVKHCKVCDEKAEVIIAKHKESQEKTATEMPKDIWKIGYGYPMPSSYPKKDPNCPVVKKEEFRSAREEIDYLYDKWKESKL